MLRPDASVNVRGGCGLSGIAVAEAAPLPEPGAAGFESGIAAAELAGAPADPGACDPATAASGETVGEGLTVLLVSVDLLVQASCPLTTAAINPRERPIHHCCFIIPPEFLCGAQGSGARGQDSVGPATYSLAESRCLRTQGIFIV